MEKVSKGLKNWFLVHFLIDIVFGIPLLFFPEFILNFIGFEFLELFSFRLIGAALIGIGGASFFTKSFYEFKIMLTFKILWSVGAIIALVISLFLEYRIELVYVLGIFVVFSVVWIYYMVKLFKTMWA
jgi:hypothetical protein